MKYAGAVNWKNYKKAALVCAAVLAALVLLAGVVQVARSALSGASLLATLPPPAEDAKATGWSSCRIAPCATSSPG